MWRESIVQYMEASAVNQMLLAYNQKVESKGEISGQKNRILGDRDYERFKN